MIFRRASKPKRVPTRRRRRLFAEQLEDRRLLTTFIGADLGDLSGSSVSSAGDVNGDGFDDLIIGAEFAAASGNAKWRAGESYVVFGSSTPAATVDLGNLGTAGLTIFGADDNDQSGRSVSGVGDVNGDGLDDLLVGAPRADRTTGDTGEGESYLIFGSTTFPGAVDLANLGSAGVVIRGAGVGDESGHAVSSAGDFNGDGFADLLIGAPLADRDGTTTDSGKAYIVFGDPALPGWINLDSLSWQGLLIDLADIGDNSGRSISSAGDIDGDGRDDIIVGAPQSDGAADARNLSGESYVIFGFDQRRTTVINKTSSNFRRRLVISGVDINDQSGTAVSGAGDVNGDGFDDLLIGAPLAGSLSNARSQAGESYLIFGGNSLPGNIDLQNPGAADVIFYGDTQDNHGIAISRAGDLNGDGFDDLVIGADSADGESDNQSAAGDVYVVFGGNSLPATIDFSLPGAAGLSIHGAVSGYQIGSTISTGEDFNGDGFDDLVIGAPLAGPAGETYLILGSDLTNSVTHAGTAANETLTGDIGANVMIGGNGDDLLVGRGGGDVLRGGEGDDQLSIGDVDFTRIVGGNGFDTLSFETAGLSLDLTERPDNRILGIERIDIRGTGSNSLSLGWQDVLNISDESNTLIIRRDDDDSVTIGNGWTRGEDETIDGEAFRVFTFAAATVKIESDHMIIDLATLPIGQGATYFGINLIDFASFVGGAGDVNGDGLDDFLIGAPEANPGSGKTGQTYLVYGTESPPSATELSALGTAGVTINGIDTFDDSGNTVALADINGDGFSDLLIGSPHANGQNNAYESKGESYVIFGGPSLPSTIDLASLGTHGITIFGAANADRTGISINNAGDVNSDGFDDIVIGSHYKGLAYLVFGGPDLAATIDLASLGSAGVSMFGASNIGRGGDFNGDGFDDMLVSNPAADSGRGRTYVVYGAATMPETITMSFLGAGGVTINGKYFREYSGDSLSFAGDVNGDGFDDLVTSDLNGTSHIVFGGPSLPSTIDLRGLGSGGVEFQALVHRGLSVGSAGDVNGDGFDDLVIGSGSGDGIDESKIDSGETYIIFGNAALPPVIDTNVSFTGLTIYGVDAGDSSGGFVDMAGDVNGDGFDDILIGAIGGNGISNGTIDAGESYLVLGGDFRSTATHTGTSQADLLSGDTSPNVMIGGRGDDELLGGGGRDVLRGGEGDDVLAIADLTFARLVGGNGFDTLRLDASNTTLDLTTLPDNRIVGIEQIDISGIGDNALVLDRLEVLNISNTSNTLVVRKDPGDTLDFGVGWTQQPAEWIDGDAFHVFTQGAAILKVQTPTMGVNLTVNLSEVAENGATTVTVTATNESNVTGNQSVDLIASGTATSPEDYLLSATQIVILDGQSSGSVTFTVQDDAVIEAFTETATLTISNPSSGLALGVVTSQTVKISDDDFVTPVIASTETSPTRQTLIPITVDFGDFVTGFDQADLKVAGATVSSFVEIGSGQFSFNVTPTGDGTITINVDAGAAADIGGKRTLNATQFSVVSDRTGPVPTITGPASPTHSDPFVVTIDFGGSVSDFVIGDVSVGGGTASNLIDLGGGQFTASIDAAADGTVSVGVPASVAIDVAGNENAAATLFSVVVDTIAPIAVITGPGSPTNSDPFTVTIDFADPVIGFAIGDISVGGGTVSNLVDIGNGKYTASIDALTEGSVTVDVAANVATDIAGNGNVGASQFSIVIDTTALTPTITGPGSPTNLDPFTATIDFREPVTGFELGDIVVGGGAASNLVDLGAGRFTVSIDAIADGLVTIDVAAGAATDEAGNLNSAAGQFATIVDTVSPVPSITGPASPTSSGQFSVTIDFGELVNGFVIGDITVGSGTASNLLDNGDGRFTATIDVVADGLVTVDVAAGVAFDRAGNANIAAPRYAIFVDTTPPAPTITGPASPTKSAPFTVTIDFNEPVKGFIIGAVDVGGATASNLVDNGNGRFTVTINPISDGLVTVDIAANVTADELGNPNVAAAQFAIVVDTVAPTTTIIGPDGPTNVDSFMVTIDFAEPVSGFEIGDLVVGGGTASNLLDNGDGRFTATIDGEADGLVTVDVAANVAADHAGNANVAATRFSVLVDTSSPAPTITGPAAPTSSDPFTVTIDFGETVYGFFVSDLVVGGGTASNLVDNGNGRFTATIDVTTDGLVTVNVGADSAIDNAGNPNVAAPQFLITVDTAVPAPTITGPAGPIGSDSFTATIDFGEPVNGFVLSDLVVGGGTAGNLLDNGNGRFTATINASADGLVTVDLAAYRASDNAGNFNIAAAPFSIVVDTTAPTPLITGPANPTGSNPFTVTIDFGETVNGFTVDDVTVGGGTASNLVDHGNGQFSLTIEASADGEVTAAIAVNVTTDIAGNNNAAAPQYSIVVDTTAPTPTITGPASPTNSDPFDVTIDFGETVSGFASGNILVGGGNVTNFVNEGSGRYSATIDAVSNGTVTVDVAANVANDSAGNANVAADRYSVDVDTTALVPIIVGPGGPTNVEQFDVTINFREAVTGFSLSDLQLNNATANNLIDNGAGLFTVTVVPLAAGTVTVEVPANVAQDIASNPNFAATPYSIFVDRTFPAPVVTGPVTITNSNPFNVTINFGESVIGFEQGDITIVNGTVTNFVDNGVGRFSATIDATNDGDVTLDVAANVAVDRAGNNNGIAVPFTVLVDTTAPTAVITGPASHTNSDPFTIAINFAETITGFALSDIAVGGGTASNLVDNGNGHFTATIDAATDGLVIVDIAANVGADDAGNLNDASTRYSTFVDTAAPTPTISGPTNPTNNDPFHVAIEFGEAIVGFNVDDIAVVGGTVSQWVDNGNGHFTATIDATANGDVTVNVASDAATDLAGNANFAANPYSTRVDTVAPTPAITVPPSPSGTG
ncbi:MAG: Ig-like domain-containing protein, partial [Rubripirellula sp.]